MGLAGTEADAEPAVEFPLFRMLAEVEETFCRKREKTPEFLLFEFPMVGEVGV